MNSKWIRILYFTNETIRLPFQNKHILGHTHCLISKEKSLFLVSCVWYVAETSKHTMKFFWCQIRAFNIPIPMWWRFSGNVFTHTREQLKAIMWLREELEQSLMTKQPDVHTKFFNLALKPSRDKRFFNYPNCPDPLCSPPSLMIQQVQDVFSAAVKLLGHEVDHPPPSF